MIHIMNSKSTRPYSSDIREKQKQKTRTRILQGLIQVMADGIADVSIPAVAEASGVSIPTIYRYFSTKEELINALPAFLAQQIGAPQVQAQPDLDQYLEMIQTFYAQADNMDQLMRAAAVSEAASNIRRSTGPERLRMIDHMLAPFMVDLALDEQKRLRKTVLILATSAVIRAFTEYLNLSWEEAADHATWAIRMLIKGVTVADPDRSEFE